MNFYYKLTNLTCTQCPSFCLNKGPHTIFDHLSINGVSKLSSLDLVLSAVYSWCVNVFVLV